MASPYAWERGGVTELGAGGFIAPPTSVAAVLRGYHAVRARLAMQRGRDDSTELGPLARGKVRKLLGMPGGLRAVVVAPNVAVLLGQAPFGRGLHGPPCGVPSAAAAVLGGEAELRLLLEEGVVGWVPGLRAGPPWCEHRAMVNEEACVPPPARRCRRAR